MPSQGNYSHTQFVTHPFPLFKIICTFVLQMGISHCGHAPPGSLTLTKVQEAKHPPTGPQKIVLDPIKLINRAPESRVPSDKDIEILEAQELFDLGGRNLSAKKYQEAIRHYQMLQKHFPDSAYMLPTLYNLGLAYEWMGSFQDAVIIYRNLIEQFSKSKEALDASFRQGGCYAELRNWPASAEVFQRILKRTKLSITDRLEAYARQGLAYFRLGDHRRARTTFNEGIREHQSVSSLERLDSDFFLAMAHYYSAAIPHIDFRDAKIDTQDEMAKTLDEKARLLLQAQNGYIQTIKVKNPYWATAAGFQIGSLYREFYMVLLTSLPDFSKQAQANSEKVRISKQEAQNQIVQVYLEEVHKRVKPLLDKAIRVFEKNVLMAERVGIESAWVTKSRQQMEELRNILSLNPEEAVRRLQEDRALPEDKPLRDTEIKEPLDKAPTRPDQLPPLDIEPGKAYM